MIVSALSFGAVDDAEGQRARPADRTYTARSAAAEVPSSTNLRSEALEQGRFAVVIDLDHNQLHFKQGEHTLWSAPIGTGTGLLMKDDSQDWDFSTPNGVFHVKFKERNPVWIAEDWYFVENGLPVPPPNDPARYFPGGLGEAAVYFDHELAIHGTDKPELLGQRVSHGCIRLSNRDALRLYHNVQVGTEIIIIGGENLEQQEMTPTEARDLSAAIRAQATGQVVSDPLFAAWTKMSTRDLLLVLDSELWEDARRSRWSEVMHLLSDRGLEGDRMALAGLLTTALDLPESAAGREYPTFLADAFARAAAPMLESLSRLEGADREHVASLIVDATMDLYHGDLEGPTAPWPTRRIPRTALDADARPGWNALREAEQSFDARLTANSEAGSAARRQVRREVI